MKKLIQPAFILRLPTLLLYFTYYHRMACTGMYGVRCATEQQKQTGHHEPGSAGSRQEGSNAAINKQSQEGREQVNF